MNIFKSDYINLFTEYGYGINSVGSIISGIGYTANDLTSEHAIDHAKEVIKILLNFDIIKISNWGKYNFLLKSITLSQSEKILCFETIWSKESKSHNFIEFFSFEYTSWYREGLRREGINENTDWEWFSREFVVNMESWIKQNKPKDIE